MALLMNRIAQRNLEIIAARNTNATSSEKQRLTKAHQEYNSQRQAVENALFEENQCHAQEAILND